VSRREPTVNSSEVRYLLERFYALPRREQLQAFLALRDYLGAEEVVETDTDRATRLRVESLDVMATVAAHHGLPAGKAPTATQWRTTPPEVTQGWSATRIVQVWGRYRFAASAFSGEPMTSGASHLSIKRRQVARRRTREDEYESVRRWLATQSASRLAADYNEFVKEHNDAVDEGRLDAKPLWTARQLIEYLGIEFADVIEVVEGGTTLQVARERALRRRVDDPGNDLGLIGRRAVASILGYKGPLSELLKRPGFPTSVMRIGGGRIWLMSDIEAYRDGLDVPTREESEMQALIVTTSEMAQLRGYPNGTVVTGMLRASPNMLPPADGRINGAVFWRRTTVEEWLPTAPSRRRPYRRRPVKPADETPETAE
jgi:hypothetical protein